MGRSRGRLISRDMSEHTGSPIAVDCAGLLGIVKGCRWGEEGGENRPISGEVDPVA